MDLRDELSKIVTSVIIAGVAVYGILFPAVELIKLMINGE
jgi:hypothetical protein